MKKITLFLIGVLQCVNIFAQAPQWAWAEGAGGTNDDRAYSVVVDASGNAIVAGSFRSATITFGSTTLTNANNNGSFSDFFLAKYDASGNVIWAKSNGDVLDEVVRSVDVDNAGNIYIAGYFGSATLTLGSITLTNSSANYYDVFFAKYDSNGNIIWAKSATGTNGDLAQSVAIDASGHIYLAGNFNSPTLSFGSTVLTNNDNTGNTTNFFLAKFDNNGNILWAKSGGGSTGPSSGGPFSVALDANGHAYLAGEFSIQSIVLGTTTLTNASVGTRDIFLEKFDTNGNVLWAKSAGGNSQDLANSLAVDASGNIFMAGNFYSTTITFGTSTFTNAGSDDVFLTKYDNNGNVIWARNAGGPGDDWATSVALDVNGNPYLAGYFPSPTITFGSSTLTNINVAYPDIFVVKYTTNGNVTWAKSAGGMNEEYANSIAINANHEAIVTGAFWSSPINFDSYSLTKVGSYDVFVAKLNSIVGIDERSNNVSFTIAPNPFTSETTITFSEDEPHSLKLTDLLGKDLKTWHFTGKELKLERGNLKSGIYF
ncbi:MAG: hypothetical protein WCP52_13900, partial [Bacteroidota bacterium]